MLVHASIGIANGDTDARTADELLANADIAMYTAKGSGKRRYAFYEPRMHTRVRRRYELSAALEQAIDRDEISVYYQPIVVPRRPAGPSPSRRSPAGSTRGAG